MRAFCGKMMMIITMAIMGASFLGLTVLPVQAGVTDLGGSPWIWTLSGRDKGAFMVRFDGPQGEALTGYGLNFFIFKPFTIEPDPLDPIVIDSASRKIDGTLLLQDITDATKTVGKIVLKGTYSKNFFSMSLKGTIFATIEGNEGQFTEGVKVTIVGHRFDESKPPIRLAEGIEKGKLTSKTVKGSKLSVSVEPSDLVVPGGLPNRLGILSGGGGVKTNNVPFNLNIEDSVFFLTDRDTAYGQFLSNLFDGVYYGAIKTSKTDSKVKLTLTLHRFDLKENISLIATLEEAVVVLEQ
jgi:hypothetical protein